MSVNVSGRQLGDPARVVADVAAVLEQSGRPPACLRLEITESTVISRRERVRSALTELAELGVHAEIDDFGAIGGSYGQGQVFARATEAAELESPDRGLGPVRAVTLQP